MATSVIQRSVSSNISRVKSINAERTIRIDDLASYSISLLVIADAICILRNPGISGNPIITDMVGSSGVTGVRNGAYSVTLTCSKGATNWVVYYQAREA